MLIFQECFFGFYFENIKDTMFDFQECFFGFYFENIKEYTLFSRYYVIY
jgi:hypothetical protein